MDLESIKPGDLVIDSDPLNVEPDRAGLVVTCDLVTRNGKSKGYLKRPKVKLIMTVLNEWGHEEKWVFFNGTAGDRVIHR